jgi:hypothetical protein
LQQQAAFEEETNKKLNQTYIEAQEEIRKNTIEMESLREQYSQGAEDIEELSNKF